jgi:Tol biopolymer transport system component
VWKVAIALGLAGIMLAGAASIHPAAPNAAPTRLAVAAGQSCTRTHDEIVQTGFELQVAGKPVAEKSLKPGVWVRTMGQRSGADLCLKDHHTWCRLSGPTIIQVKPPKKSGILLRSSRGKPSCSMEDTEVQLQRKGGSWLLRLGKPKPAGGTTASVYSERTPVAATAVNGDPVFSFGVGNAPSVVKVQRGVAVVVGSGPKSLKRAVVLGRNQQAAVPRESAPSKPRAISLSTTEQKVFAELEKALPDTDKTPPAVKIVEGPPRRSSLRSATFRFAAGQGVTFTCALDKIAIAKNDFRLCTTPYRIERTTPGRHTLAVKALDSSGNTSALARYSWTIDGSRILFTSDRTGNRQIWVMDPDGMNQEQLTNDSAEDDDPEWSPDGKKIVFHSNRDGNFEIYVMNADGSNATPLTHDPAIDRNPTWSPDGSQIAFESYRANGNRDVWVMNADGSNVRRLTEDPAEDLDPAWSPDGQKIAFSTTRTGTHEIYLMNPDGSGQTRLTSGTNELNPAWSPDGTEIAYHSLASDGYQNIFTIDPNGGIPTQLTHTDQNDYNPAWAPDGNEIVFHSTRKNPPVSQIFVMNADGSGQKPLTTEGGNIVPDW